MERFINRSLSSRTMKPDLTTKLNGVLGKGSICHVERIRKPESNDDTAVKVYDFRNLPKDVSEEELLAICNNEGKFLKRLRGKRIAPEFYNAWLVKEQNELVEARIEMEMLKGITLQDYIEKNGPLSEIEVLHLASMITTNVVFGLHKLGYVHNDLKPSQIILIEDQKIHDQLPEETLEILRNIHGAQFIKDQNNSERGIFSFQEVRIIDYGTCSEVGKQSLIIDWLVKQGLATKNPLQNIADRLGFGTPGYAPIEQYSESYASDFKTDVYALGAIIYFMIKGEKLPGAEERLAGVEVPKIKVVSNLSPCIERVISGAINLDKEQRTENIRFVNEIYKLSEKRYFGLNIPLFLKSPKFSLVSQEQVDYLIRADELTHRSLAFFLQSFQDPEIKKGLEKKFDLQKIGKIIEKVVYAFATFGTPRESEVHKMIDMGPAPPEAVLKAADNLRYSRLMELVLDVQDDFFVEDNQPMGTDALRKKYYKLQAPPVNLFQATELKFYDLLMDIMKKRKKGKAYDTESFNMYRDASITLSDNYLLFSAAYILSGDRKRLSIDQASQLIETVEECFGLNQQGLVINLPGNTFSASTFTTAALAFNKALLGEHNASRKILDKIGPEFIDYETKLYMPNIGRNPDMRSTLMMSLAYLALGGAFDHYI